MNDVSILKTNCVKYLGLLIDDQLCFKQHIDDLCNYLVKFNGIFYRLRASLTPAVATQLYYSLVFSKLSYGVEIYGMTKPLLLKPLQILQKKF